MNFIQVLKELWQRRLLVAVAAVLALVVSVALVYDVSVAPPSISKRDHVEAQGSIEILVDSAQSPIGDVGRELTPLSERAGVFARYIAGGNVIKAIAKSTGIPASQIEVAGPRALPGEAPGSESAAPQLLPYGIEIAQGGTLPILSVVTRAPTVEEARALAAAAPAAVSDIVTSIQREQGVPERKRVIFRALGPAEADPVTDAHGAKVAVLVFLAVFAFGLLLILGIPRLVTAWRTVDAEAAQPPHEQAAEHLHAVDSQPVEGAGGDAPQGSSETPEPRATRLESPRGA